MIFLFFLGSHNATTQWPLKANAVSPGLLTGSCLAVISHDMRGHAMTLRDENRSRKTKTQTMELL